MRRVKSFEMLQEAKKEKRELKEEQLVMAIKDELSGIVGKLHKYRAGDDGHYKKGDVFMFMGEYKSTNWEVYLNFAITRGHGDGRYSGNEFIRYERKDFWKNVDKGNFKLIDDIAERDKLLDG